VFFDRDGVVNRSPGPGYVERWEEFVLLDGFVDALRVVRRHGWDAVIVTNQRGVALGVMSMEEVDRIHAGLKQVLDERHGLSVLDIRVCPHGKDACLCRKPQPGMILDAARLHGIDLAASWMAGDSESDVEAGRRAGCRTIRICAAGDPTQADERVESIDALAALLDGLLG
jgi:D-glycero-D-manno-heptose 1,7-bisphosphate phosphatase